MRIQFVIIALLAASPAAATGVPLPHSTTSDPELARCLTMQAAQAGIVQVTACYNSALNRTDAAIARAASALSKQATERKLDGDVAKGLSAWRTYRDHWCEFEERFEGDPGARQSTGLMCRYELGQAQLARITNAN